MPFRTLAHLFGLLLLLAVSVRAERTPGMPAVFHRDSLAVPEEQKFTVSLAEYPGLVCPNPRGWYHHVANVVTLKDGSPLACYRVSDSHNVIATFIVVARSIDGGRNWTGHRVIARANVWVDRAVWVPPQISLLKDGRVVVLDNSYSFDTGYSSWTQMPGGRIAILDYTNGGILENFPGASQAKARRLSSVLT